MKSIILKGIFVLLCLLASFKLFATAGISNPENYAYVCRSGKVDQVFEYHFYKSDSEDNRICALYNNSQDNTLWYAIHEISDQRFCPSKVEDKLSVHTLEDKLSVHIADGFSCFVELSLKDDG